MELPKNQLPRSLPRYYNPLEPSHVKNSPFLGGTRGIVLLSSRVWKDVNGWALEIGISCTYSNPVIIGGRKHTHTIQNLMKEIHCIFSMPNPMTDFCITAHEDNMSAIAMTKSLKFTPCTKHIAIKYHHFCSRVQTSSNPSGDIKIKYISTKKQLADIFIKPIDAGSFFTL